MIYAFDLVPLTVRKRPTLLNFLVSYINEHGLRPLAS
jgi:hypothetical protein